MIAVIGAGISGLCSALTLSRLGHKVLLLDKGRSAGGRLATRYLEAESGQGYINTAAHEINVDDASPQFTKIMHEFFPSQCSPDGRYRAPKGINWFTKHLASYLKDQSVDVHFEQTVNKIGYSKSSKIFTIATNTTSFEASGLVLTLPYPQSRNLLDTCDEIRLDPGHLPQYYKSLLLLLWPKEVVLPGSLPSSANIHKVVLQDKIQANRSPYPLAVHATYAWSREHFSCADQSIKERLMEELHLQETDFIRVSVKRWGFAQPVFRDQSVNRRERSGYIMDESAAVALCTDALGLGTIASAAEAGINTAKVISGRLSLEGKRPNI